MVYTETIPKKLICPPTTMIDSNNNKFVLLKTYTESTAYRGDNNSTVIIAQFTRHIGALGTIWQ